MNREPSSSERYDLLYYFLLSLGAFLITCLQAGFFSHVLIFGAVPDLALIFISAVAFRWGAKKGSVVGIVAGAASSALMGTGNYLTIPFCFLFGAAAGIFSESRGRRTFGGFFALTSVGTLIRSMVSFFELCLRLDSFDPITLILKMMIPGIFATLLFIPLIYPITKIGERGVAGGK